MSAVTDRIMDQIRVKVPGAVDAAIHLEMFMVVDELRRQYLQVDPALFTTPEIEAWLTEAEWLEFTDLIVHGTLARLFAQPLKPYTNGELAQLSFQIWRDALTLVRTNQTVYATNTSVQRILENVRTQIPQIRDQAIVLELFNVVDDLCRTTLQITAPNSGATDPSTWLTAAQWDKYYRLLIHGTLARLLAQPARPWTNTELATYNFALFNEQREIARTDASSDGSLSMTALLLDTLRVRLPGSRDGVLLLEIYNTVDEFCRTTHAYVVQHEIYLSPNQTLYPVTLPGKEVLTMQTMAHATYDIDDVLYDGSQISLATLPTADDVRFPVCFDLAVTPIYTDPIVVEDLLPNTLMGKHYQTILSGVLYRMMAQPAKPYSNLQLANYHGKKFRSDMAIAERAAQTNDIPGAQLWRFPRWA